MATTFIHMGGTRDQSPSTPQKLQQQQQPSNIKTRGRKPSSKPPKRIPQRGMGVEQLERLRMQQQQINIINNPPARLSDLPVRGVPVLHGSPNYAGPSYHRFETGSGHVAADPVWIGAPARFETSKELSSIPKLPTFAADRCDICFKKKRCNGEGFRSSDHKYTIKSPINGCDFLGFNQGKTLSFGRDNIGGYGGVLNHAIHNINQGLEVFGSGWTGNPSTTTTIKEYEFFPGKYDFFAGKEGGQNTYSKEVVEASVAVSCVGEPSCAITDTSHSPNSSNTTIDLSLKL